MSGSLIETTKSWKAVVPVNGTMIPGMSGGPEFNASGEIAGINVGTMMMSNEMGFGTFTGYGFIVPSSAICQLLAR